jgi:cobalt-zinc-cadmium efflux system outer membrane protein
MGDRRWLGLKTGCLLLAILTFSTEALAQAPTIEETGILTTGVREGNPGSMDSLLGPMPGSSGIAFGMQPGRDDLILGRAGTSGPRVPTTITTPGGVYEGPPQSQGATAPLALPVPRAPFFGTLELPKLAEDEGPPDGLTLDQAIDMHVKNNLDLRSKYLEIPQARADVLTASLRANPIFYADSQLVPYGSDSVRRPGGPTQYDVNVSYPLDLSHKRRARMAYATRALEVMEAQYQNEIRLSIQNLYVAYVDLLAARETVRYVRTSIDGLNEFLRINRGLYKQKNATSADVDQAESDRAVAAAGLMDAEANLLHKKRILGELLNWSLEDSERIEPKGTIGDMGPDPPEANELMLLAFASRPDVRAYQLGIAAAQSNVQLQLANRFSDAYLLVQPYTFQNNAPFGTQSATSWAMGITVPLPIYNRNQGNIERSRINVDQSRVQLAALERRIATEVRQALDEYRVSAHIVEQIRREVLSASERAVRARLKLFDEGEVAKVIYLDTQRKYNEYAKSYLDALVRHRRAMLTLNTVVGQRILP